MAGCCSPTFIFVLIRAVHYIACLLLLATWVFDRLVLPAVATSVLPSLRRRWEVLEGRWTLLLLPIIGISGAAWFVQLCVNMSGLSLTDAMHADTIRAVWSQTNFGRVWQVRSILWLSWGYLPPFIWGIPRFFRSISAWINVMLAGALVSSLAWAGHGQDGGPWHLFADAGHLFIAGLWPMGLAPFALLLFQLRKLPQPQRRAGVAALTFRFSAMSLISVGLLAITGVINSLYMIRSFSDLVGINYGRLLIFKVTVFLIMFSLGAVNLIRLKPRLLALESDAAAGGAAASLQWNVAVELSLAFAVVIATAVLGLLAPPGS
jgi:putative copper export protein